MGKYSKITAKGTTIHIYEFDPRTLDDVPNISNLREVVSQLLNT